MIRTGRGGTVSFYRKFIWNNRIWYYLCISCVWTFYTRKLCGIAGTRPESYFIRNRTSYPKLPLNFSSKQVALAFNTVDGSRPPFQKFTRSWNMHLRALYIYIYITNPWNLSSRKFDCVSFIIVKFAARDCNSRYDNTKDPSW